MNNRKHIKDTISELVDDAYRQGVADANKNSKSLQMVKVMDCDGVETLEFRIGRAEHVKSVEIRVDQAAMIAEVYADRIEEYKQQS